MAAFGATLSPERVPGEGQESNVQLPFASIDSNAGPCPKLALRCDEAEEAEPNWPFGWKLPFDRLATALDRANLVG